MQNIYHNNESTALNIKIIFTDSVKFQDNVFRYRTTF